MRWTGTGRLLSAAAGWQRTPPVVTYHRVVADFAANARYAMPSMLVSRQMLERHLDWVGRRFSFVSLDELGSHLDGGESARKTVAAITFDDGYRDVYEHAFPLFQRKGIPAAMFVVTDLVGTSNLQVHDRIYLLVTRVLSAEASARRDFGRFLFALGIRSLEAAKVSGAGSDAAAVARALFNDLPQAELLRVCEALESCVGPEDEAPTALLPVTWEMLGEMHRAGWTIGSHTCTHALLTNESPARIREETAGSRRELEHRLGITVDHFAYPAGLFDSMVVSAVAAAGYRFAYATCPHRDQSRARLTIPRRVLWQNSSLDAFGRFSTTMMSFQVKTPFDLRTRCTQDHTRHRTEGARASDHDGRTRL
jgi:peptidoglycan/xylan/chitin deacetylase (PgdA/CDA1 family)